MKLDQDISRRISIAKFLMIIGVVIIHIPPYTALPDLAFNFTDTTKAFFSHAFFRAGVPILAAISGYLLFRSSLHLNMPKLIIKKARTLIIPLIIWNIPFAIVIVAVQYYNPHIYDAAYILYPFSLEGWLNGVFSMYNPPFNKPLYFLRDLFVIAVLAPLYWQLFKKIPYLGFAVIIVIFAYDLDGPLITRDSMYAAYYLGILAATQKWDLRMLDKYAYPLFALYVMGCIFMIFYKIDNRDAYSIIAPFLIWPILSKITYTRAGDILVDNAKPSFLLFLSHVPIMFIFYQLYMRIDNNIPYLVFWLVTPVITTFIIIKFLSKTEQISPPLYRLSTGGR